MENFSPAELAAIIMAGVSLFLSGIAYWRAGGRADIATLKRELREEIDSFKSRQRAIAEDLRKRINSGYEDTLSRIKRGERRLADLRQEVSASMQEGIDAVSRQLAELKVEAEEGITRLKHDVSIGAQATQEAVGLRIRRLEGRIQILMVRAEMARAQRLADKRSFIDAEKLLEDAVAKVREVKARLSDDFEENPAFSEVITSLQNAIRSVRAEAEDSRHELDRVLSSSESLLSSLASREQRLG